MAKKSTSKNTSLFENIENVSGKFDRNKLLFSLGIFCIFLSIFFVSALFGAGGKLGDNLFNFLTESFGIFSYICPFFALFLSYIFLFKKEHLFLSLNFLLSTIIALCLFVGLGFLDMSGVLGKSLATNFANSIGVIPTIFIFSITIALSLVKVFDADLGPVFKSLFISPSMVETENSEKENLKEIQKPERKQGLFSRFNFLNLFSKKNTQGDYEEDYRDEKLEGENVDDEYEYVDTENGEDMRDSMFRNLKVDLTREEKQKIKVRKEKPTEIEDTKNTKKDTDEKLRQLNDTYRRPPLSLYTEDSGKPSAGDNKENARIIKRTLNDFGISVEMDEVTVGPTVTRYALKPAQGVKIEKIMNLANNIALELGVPSVSIIRVHEKSLIGIEVPNKTKAKLGLAALFSNSQFLERKDKLTMTLGKDLYGDPVFADMSKMPHLLVAGTTGSGKSVLLHGIINSLVYKNSPYDLKFILVDPKKVEFALYSNLPHLYTPVIKDPKKAVQTLNWLVQEMDRRYEVLESCGKQNIAAYHQFVLEKYKRAENSRNPSTEKLPEKMPYIVLVIDELADFMMKFPKEMEAGIVKLAQMSRAVGIHLILATQRPSTNVITGVIKGNVPSRVALRVASQVDSRVIIDQGGAEKLLGYGDMLFVSAEGGEMKRIQSPNVTEEEIKDVVAFLREEYDDILTEELKTSDGQIIGASTGTSVLAGGNYSGEEDDRYEEAKEIVIQGKQASTSYLQRRMGVGYSRAAKLIDILEAKGVISAQTPGQRQRKILVGENGSESAETLENEANAMLENAGAKDIVEETKKEEREEKAQGFFRF